MADPLPKGVQFEEAIEFLRRRLDLTSSEWRAIWAEAGGIAREATDQVGAAVARDLLKAVADVLAEGGTLEDFRKRYAAVLQEAGWSAEGKPGWHSRLVYRLHIGNAYAAGRYEQAERMQAARPERQLYFRYVTIGDHRVRPQHRAWHGIILPIGHPFWKTHYPPNGFNCRCHVQVVADRDLRRYGWDVTPDTDPRLQVPPEKGWAGNVGFAGARLRQARGQAPVEVPATPVAEVDEAGLELAARLGVFDDAEGAAMTAADLLAGIPADELPRMRAAWQTRGQVLRFEGRSEGATIVRSFSEGDNGLEVTHDFFRVDPEYQGGGHARAMMRGALDAYRRMGATAIRVHANIDVGGYAWARLGFVPDDPDDLFWQIETALDRIARDRIASATDIAEAREALSDPDNFAWRVARSKLGRKLLFNSDWYGTLDLRDADALARTREAIDR
jgi:SPP1 gp7 family putative phage head morphogenesis protein